MGGRDFGNCWLMKEKDRSSAYEDPVSFGVNAAKPLVAGHASRRSGDRIEYGDHLHGVRRSTSESPMSNVLPQVAGSETKLPPLRSEERPAIRVWPAPDGGVFVLSGDVAGSESPG